MSALQPLHFHHPNCHVVQVPGTPLTCSFYQLLLLPLLLLSTMAGVRIAAPSGPPLLLAVLSLLPGVVGGKVGCAEEGAKEGKEGNGCGVVGSLPLLLLPLLQLPLGVVVFAVVVAVSSVDVALVL